MKKISRLSRFFAVCLFLFLSFTAFGQDTLLGVVEYLDDPLEAQIFLPDGSETEAYIGLELTGGTIIQTFFTSVEIRLTAGGSLLRLSENTLFRIEAQRITGEKKVNAFTLAAGTVRCVAARASDQGYAVHTPTAAMGVRGTDFIVEVFQGGETLSVLDGVVEALHKDTGRSNLVQAGFFQNLMDENAVPQVLTDALRDQLLQKNGFQALDPAEVVHQTSEPGAVDLAQETREREPAGEDGKSLWDMMFTPRTEGSADASGDKKDKKAPKKERKEEGDVSFVLSAGLHPELVQIAQSTWTQLLGMGVGGSV
ncbi:MAG: FecR domain-containing protein, partial [Spirochaetales bacterium]|nr:FecR domain-containing protein [Spirochaetales bacterium]